MGKKNKEKQAEAKTKASEFIAQRAADGTLSNKDFKKLGTKGIDPTKVAKYAADQGVAIGSNAQENYGLRQGSNLYSVKYTPEAAAPRFDAAWMFGESQSGGKPKMVKGASAYLGVDDKGRNTYRFGTGQGAASGNQPASAPAPAPAAPQSTYQPESIGADESSWRAAVERSDQYSAGAGSDSNAPGGRSGYTDQSNDSLYSDMYERGNEYTRRFERFIGSAQNNAMLQSAEVGRAGRDALNGLGQNVRPDTLADAFSTDSAKEIKAFNRILLKR